MALHRFEEEAGKKLRERQIAPSPGSWEKLEARLGQDSEKRKFRIWWPALAAVLILAFLAGNLLFKKTETAPVIVEEPIIEKSENSSDPGIFKAPVEVASEEKNTPQIQRKETEIAENIPQEKIEKDEREILISASEEIENLQVEIENIKLEPPTQEINVPQTDLQEAIAMLVSEQAEKDLTDTEVDKLLLEAASQIAREQNFVGNARVNASALLADVEAELDQSFRQKVFEMLKEGYAEARYTFVNRNN